MELPCPPVQQQHWTPFLFSAVNFSADFEAFTISHSSAVVRNTLYVFTSLCSVNWYGTNQQPIEATVQNCHRKSDFNFNVNACIGCLFWRELTPASTKTKTWNEWNLYIDTKISIKLLKVFVSTYHPVREPWSSCTQYSQLGNMGSHSRVHR